MIFQIELINNDFNRNRLNLVLSTFLIILFNMKYNNGVNFYNNLLNHIENSTL